MSSISQVFNIMTLFAACTSFSVLRLLQYDDVDAGEMRHDIPEINSAAGISLFEGDILLLEKRSAIRDEQLLWKLPIPFILSDNLDLNAKGVILKTFEGFHLKSCVKFKPYDGEKSYILFQKLDGCWSSIGDAKRGQNLSVGAGCDHKAIITHEVLHTLGLFHEHTRTDRDDYVKIWWDNVIPEQMHNFKKYNTIYQTDLNTPYDYESIMHYGPFSFSKNSSLTITAKIPEFNHIIGQRLDFSISDLERLNHLYNCTRSLTLLDHCNFESANICGLVHERRDDAGWVRKKSHLLKQDHCLDGQYKDFGHFMYFDTSTGKKGETAVLQSRILFPNRKHQCLQLFFKITGSHQDKLVIWIKKDDDSEKMCKVRTFQGDDDDDWKIAHVNLKSQKKFRYLIYGLKGEPDDSSGGISIDDLTLSETQCPGSVWLIRNFSTILKTSTENHVIWSPRFYSHEGYGYGVSLFPRGPGGSVAENYIGISFHLVSGENDDALEWPALHRQVTITVLDQDPNIKERMSSEKSFTTDSAQILPGGGNTSRWGKPLAGKYDPLCNCIRSRGLGWSRFISHAQLRRRNYLRNDDLIIFAEFEDLRHLMKTEHSFPQMWSILENEPLEQKRSELPRDWKSSQIVECNPNPCQSDGIGKISKGNQAADLEIGVTSGKAKFADDTKLYRVVKTKDCEKLQRTSAHYGVGFKMADGFQYMHQEKSSIQV